MTSYARFDKLARELDAERCTSEDFGQHHPEDHHMTAAQRDLPARRFALHATPPFGSVVIVDGLEKAGWYNGCSGVVASGKLCGGERAAARASRLGARR